MTAMQIHTASKDCAFPIIYEWIPVSCTIIHHIEHNTHFCIQSKIFLSQPDSKPPLAIVRLMEPWGISSTEPRQSLHQELHFQ